jgi:3'-5' exoribonuclease
MNKSLTINQFRAAVLPEQARHSFTAQVEEISKKTTTNQAVYYEVKFRDHEGSLVLKCWDSCLAYSIIRENFKKKEKHVMEVSGLFQKNRHGIGGDWEIRILADHEKPAFFAGEEELRSRQEEAFKFILHSIHGSMKDRDFKAIVRDHISKNENEFRRAGAARGNHHARRGGLVEHVAEMMRIAHGQKAAFPELNLDLMIAGIYFHDIGKLKENQFEEDGFEMPHSVEGWMLGHIIIGIKVVGRAFDEYRNELAKSGPISEERHRELLEKQLHLEHIVGSHHGEIEWGSPIVPATLEAAMVHFADNQSAKREMMLGCRKTSRELAPGMFEKVHPMQAPLVIVPDWSSRAVDAASC